MNPTIIPTANALRYDPFFMDGPIANTLRYYRNNVPEGISRLCYEIEDFIDFMNSNSDNLQNEDYMQDIYYFLRSIDEYVVYVLSNNEMDRYVKDMCMRRLNRTRELLMNIIDRYNRKSERKSKKSLNKKKKNTRSSSKSKPKSSQVGGKRSRRR